MTPDRVLKPLKAREKCPKGHEVVVVVHPLERMKWKRAHPGRGVIMLPCPYPGCGCDTWVTAGAIQRAA